MIKAKSTVKRQLEYDLHKTYVEEVLLTCHKDHIDIMETYYINAADRDSLLNTTFNKPSSDGEYRTIVQNLPLLQHSTAELLSTIVAQFKTIKDLEAQMMNPSYYITKQATLIKKLNSEVLELEAENDELLKRITN